MHKMVSAKAKQVMNSIKPNLTKAPPGPTQKGSAGYDNVRDDIEKVKKLREGSIEKVPILDNDIMNKKAVDILTTNHPHQDVQTTASPSFTGLDVQGNITTTGSVDGIDIAGMSAFVVLNSAHRNDITGADHSSLVTAVGLNTAKNTNVSTELSVGTNNTTELSITSDGGVDDITLPVATTAVTGVMNSAMYDNYVLNNAKNTDVNHNVTTNLSLGTKAATTMDVNSSDGTNATLIEADTTNAGLLGADKWDEIVANTLKKTSMWEVDGTETQLITADELDMQSKKIINVTDCTANQDAATKKYVDTFANTAATVYLSAVQDVPTATSTLVEFDTEEFDVGNNFNTGTYKYIVPSDGKYMVTLSIRANEVMAVGKIILVYVYVGAVNVMLYQSSVATGGSAKPQIVGSKIIACSEDDEITLRFYHNQGANMGIFSSATRTYMSIVRVA